MNYLPIVRKAGAWAAMLAVLLLMGLMTGCGSTGPVYAGYPDENGVIRGQAEYFRPGDLVKIAFAAPGQLEIKEHEERVKEDGTITPPEIGTVKAAGKTAGELQKEIQTEYNKIYRNLTVTVKPGDRFYYVNGEIKMAGPKTYLGETDVVKAIAAGGGFTEYANRRKIRVIRTDGRTEFVNYSKAIEDPAYNSPVYPGDQIVVPRRRF